MTTTTEPFADRAELWRRDTDGVWHHYDTDTEVYDGDSDGDSLTAACREWLDNIGQDSGEWFLRLGAQDSDVVTLSEVAPQ